MKMPLQRRLLPPAVALCLLLPVGAYAQEQTGTLEKIADEAKAAVERVFGERVATLA